jgi:hypothetical protein
MVLTLLLVTLAAIVIAIPIIRRHISFGSFTRSGITREDISTAREAAEHSRIFRPMRQFLVVVLPDGKVVNPRVANQL